MEEDDYFGEDDDYDSEYDDEFDESESLDIVDGIAGISQDLLQKLAIASGFHNEGENPQTRQLFGELIRHMMESTRDVAA